MNSSGFLPMRKCHFKMSNHNFMFFFLVAEINAGNFFKQPFKSLTSPKTLTEFTVMNIEVIEDGERHRFSGQGAISKRHVLADVWVCKTSEIGINDATIHTRTHMGHILNVGDSVLG